MSAATDGSLLNKPRKGREKDRKDKPLPIAERLKTVVRRLPPNLPEAVFWDSVAEWVTEDTVTWKVFYPGKPRKRLNKENIPSRAYMAFKTEDQVALFSREYDGHLFRDKAGNETYAIVEFAPYQKTPPERKKADARNATIEKDEDYISFLASLEAAPSAEPSSLEALIAASQPPPQPTTTPLLEALKAEKSAIKDKEAIFRNHAHHKETTILAANRKEDPKKGATPALKAPEPPSIGKKAGKKGPPGSSAPPPPQKPQGPGNIKINNVAGLSNGALKSPKPTKAKSTPPAKIIQGPPKVVAPPVAAALPSTAPLLTAPAVSVPQSSSQNGLAPPPRRRPMIGLPSRHFEAALSGAGVSPIAGERKGRREREREKEVGLAGSNAAAVSNPKATPPSPKRDRGAKNIKAVVAVGGLNPAATVPNSLPRIDDLPMQGDATTVVDVDRPSPAQINLSSNQAAIGGGRGRRGRGRGRGGPPIRGG